MIGGLRGTASQLAIAAVFFVMGAAVLIQKPAKAADLSGDCCADLEERVAELEATTVRKGNKKVSVTLYGKVNEATMWWDDGAEQNTYTVENAYESTRFGMKGSAKIAGDWSAGYKIEIETRVALSDQLNQFDDNNANDAAGTLNIRHNMLYLNNKKWGEVRMGLTYTPKDDIVKDTNVTDLEDSMFSDNKMNKSFLLRSTGFNNAEGLSGSAGKGGLKLRWSDISRCYGASDAFDCSTRRNGVAYWSPNWQGFSASWGWFEDDDWGAALRYKKEWGEAFEVGAGVAYENIRDEQLQAGGGGIPFQGFKRNIDEWAGSASIKHKPSGLFAFTAFSFSDINDTNTQHAGIYTGTSDPQMSAWDVQVGIQRKMSWFRLDTLGETSFWGGYLEINDGLGAGGNGGATNLGRIGPTRAIPVGTFANVTIPTEITGANVNRWYLGFDQAFDKSGLHLYAAYQHLTPNVDLVDSSLNRVNAPLDDFDLFYTGARIYF
jgi:predicted porin